MLKEVGGTLERVEYWVRHVLKSMNWIKRCYAVYEYDIRKQLILNLDQTPLSYVSPEQYSSDMKGAKNVPVKGVEEERQVTATFEISISGVFLTVKVIYEEKTKFNFPQSYNITYSETNGLTWKRSGQRCHEETMHKE